jgi:hypothetical protein
VHDGWLSKVLGSRINQEVKTRLWLLWLGVLATLMLIYASLIPLQYRPLDWPETIQRAKSIPWLQLGVYNRADWIANGLVVVPVGFLLVGALSYRGRSPRSSFLNRILELGASGLVLAFLFLLIGGIEIVQIWFPPRTVSWNDIVAGWIGAIAGVVLWLLFGCQSIEAARRIFGIQRFYDRLSAFALLACIAGFLYSIYPLDFVLSRSDWSEKLRLGRVQWGLVPHSVPKLEWGQGLLISVLRAIPFGLLGSQIQSRPLRWIWVLGIGLFLELIQLPVFSKFCSLGDVMAGWLGGAIGIFVAQPNRLWNWLLGTRWVWISAAGLWSVVLLFAFLSRSERLVVDPSQLQERWSGFLTYPLLRYYFTSEYRALTNILGKLLSFAFLGALVACCVMFGKPTSAMSHNDNLGRDWVCSPFRASLSWVLPLSIAIGFAIEIGQIYLFPLIGDLSDVGIYVLGSSSGAWLTVFLARGLSTPEPTASQSVDNLSAKDPTDRGAISPFWMLFGITLFLCGGIIAWLHPGWPGLELLMMTVLCGMVYRLPGTFPIVFVLSIVAGDAYPLTGQLVLQEYDSLLFGAFAGLCFAYLRTSVTNGYSRQRYRAEPLLFFGLGLLALSMAISLCVGLIRLPRAPWGDQLSVYFTQWNALRVAKGIGWGLAFAIAMLLVGRLRRRVNAPDWSLGFLRGCTLAGLYVGLFVGLERLVFPGLLNWSDVYRATGPFFTMHIGDQHLDAFLVMVFPLVWAHRLHPSCSSLQRWFCGLVLGLLAYGAFSTMSRATLVTLLVQIIGLVCLTWKFRRTETAGAEFRSSEKISLASVRTSLVALMLGIFFLVFLAVSSRTEAFQSRFSTVKQDWSGRVSHWFMIMKRGTTGIGGVLIGHGIGTLPSLVASEFGRPVPPIEWISMKQGDLSTGQIVLRGDWPIYVERVVSGDFKKSLQGLDLEVKLIGDADLLHITPMLVQKSMLESFGGARFPSIQAGRTWKRLGVLDLNPNESDFTGGSSLHSSWRPWSFGLGASGAGVVQFRDTTTGSIDSKSSYPWYFTCDDHMIWRANNFLVHAYYEQGLGGVSAWILLVLSTLWRGWRGISDFDSGSIAWDTSPLESYQAVSILGFVGVAFFGSLVDTPWITALLLAIISADVATVPRGSFDKDSL